MAWHNPPVRWAELERTLSGRPPQPGSGDGGDSPAWGRKRTEYAATPEAQPRCARIRLRIGCMRATENPELMRLNSSGARRNAFSMLRPSGE